MNFNILLSSGIFPSIYLIMELIRIGFHILIKIFIYPRYLAVNMLYVCILVDCISRMLRSGVASGYVCHRADSTKRTQ